jgi:hypothetical protein
MGYEIRQFDDTLQATAPWFIKLEFGSGTAAGDPSIWITVGTGTDGAGNLTGQVSTRAQVYATGDSTARGGFVSGSSNRLLIAASVGTELLAGSNNNAIVISIERTHEGNGTDNSDGLMIFTRSVSSGLSYKYVPVSGTVYVYTTASCSAPPTGTGAAGANIYAFMVRWFKPGESAPSLNVFTYFNADLTPLVPVSVNTWDTSNHTLLPLGTNVNLSLSYGGTTVALLRYD